MAQRLFSTLVLLLALSFLVAAVACSGGNKTTPPPPPAITVSLSSFPSSLNVNATSPITATVTNDSANAGVTWSCAPSGSCGSFNPTSSASGTAVTYTAPGAAANVTITATSVTDTSATKSTTVNVSAPSLAAGNYVFSLTGFDLNNSNGGSPYFYAGVFTVDSTGAITGGEQDFSDVTSFIPNEAITGGSVSASADGNLAITLNFTDTYIANGAGQVTLDASPVSSSKALLIEYDSWATSSGELDLQSTTLATPSGGYAFYATGPDFYGFPSAVGGVINVDGSGTISGNGSVMDINDVCVTNNPCAANTFSAQTLANTSAVTAPDALGRVVFTLNSTCDPSADPDLCFTGSGINGSMVLDGYMVDAGHIRLVENWNNDSFSGTTGGTALLQTGAGGFSASSVSGLTYVIGTNGNDSTGGFQVAGLLTFNSGATTMGGNMSFNDIAAQSPQGGEAISAGTYAVDPTGRVTVTGATDGTDFAFNFQLYLTGDGNAVAISMDSTAAAPDVLAGLGWLQTSSPLNAASLTGSYGLDFAQVVPGSPQTEQDAVGAFTADGVGTITGFLDYNGTVSVAVGTLSPNTGFTSSYTSGSPNGVFMVGSSSQTPFTAYAVDNTKGVIIENDAAQLSLGYFEQ